MRTALALIFTVATGLLIPAQASAEGNCPSGFYPIGGQGVQGCAPIPGRGVGASGGEPAPRVWRYENRYGALAHAASTNFGGASANKSSRAAANEEALSKCSAEGATDCELVSSYFNGCVAWIGPVNAGAPQTGGVGYGTTPDRALKAAEERCSEGVECKVFYAECSFAERY